MCHKHRPYPLSLIFIQRTDLPKAYGDRKVMSRISLSPTYFKGCPASSVFWIPVPGLSPAHAPTSALNLLPTHQNSISLIFFLQFFTHYLAQAFWDTDIFPWIINLSSVSHPLHRKTEPTRLWKLLPWPSVQSTRFSEKNGMVEIFVFSFFWIMPPPLKSRSGCNQSGL